MNVQIKDLSKRYLYEWIIRDMSHEFVTDSVTGVQGINGSGKSTFLKMISGYLSPSEGSITYSINGKEIDRHSIYQYIAFAAPYTDIINEYDVWEMYAFHVKFKTMRLRMTVDEFVSLVKLDKTKGKQIQFYSSGMKQRLQLALAILTDSKLLLLDEPTSYLDEDNKAWYTDLLRHHTSDRTIIIASNDAKDFELCHQVIEL